MDIVACKKINDSKLNFAFILGYNILHHKCEDIKPSRTISFLISIFGKVIFHRIDIYLFQVIFD
jgi:hypothetical protein